MTFHRYLPRFFLILVVLIICLFHHTTTSFSQQLPGNAGVQTAFQVGTQIDGVMAESGLPNPYGLTGVDYISSSPSTSGDVGHLETIEISAPAYAALQFAAAAIYFERKEYTKGKNCLKTAKWVLSDKDRAFTVQGGDLNALKSVTGTTPPVNPGILESLNAILEKLADPASFFSTDSLSSLMSDLGEIKVALDKTLVDAKTEFASSSVEGAAAAQASEAGSQLPTNPVLQAASQFITNPFGTVNGAIDGFMNIASYLATNESPYADVGMDPVILYSGEFRVVETDLTVKSVGIDFAFKRIYRSQWERDSVMGFNWTHNFDQRLIIDEKSDGKILFKDESGQAYAFTPNAEGGYTAPYQVLANLTKNENGYELAYADGMRKRFDVGGFLTSIADRHGNEMTFTYHTFGKQRMLRKIKDTQGREYILNYAEGRLESLKDPFGRVVRYGHNALGDLVSVRGPATSRYPEGRVTRYNYSGGHTDPALNHNLTMIMDPKGQVYLANRYGNEGYEKDRVIGQRFGAEDAPEMTARYEEVAGDGKAGSVASRTTVVNRLGVTHVYEHDAWGLRLKGDGYAYRYNDGGMKVGEVTPGGVTKAFVYDDQAEDRMKRNNLLSETISSSDGSTIEKRYTYGPYNQVKSQRVVAVTRGLTPQGPVPEVRTITYDFDVNGNRIAMHRGDETVRYFYNASGQIIRTIQNGITRDTIFDGANPAVITESGGKLKRTTTLAHSGPGFFEGMTDPLSNTTRYWVNEVGRPVRKMDALGTVTDYVYDENNNLVSVSIENKGGSNVEEIGYRLKREISYDVYDKPVLKRVSVDADRWEDERYEYDAEERLIAVTGADGVRHEYARNDKGLVTAYRRNGQLQYIRRHDKDGRTIYEKDGLGHQRWWVRDGLGRIVRYVAKDGTQTLFAYTPFGEMARLRTYDEVDGTYALLQEKRFEYDDHGRPVKEYERALGHPTEGWYLVERTYTNGRLIAVGNSDGDVKRFAYDGFGRLTETVLTNGHKSATAYDILDRVVKRSISNAGHRFEESYAYDALGRLVSAGKGDAGTAFSYDSAGNLLTARDPLGMVTSHVYDGIGRTLKQVRQGRERTFEWNERGFLGSFIDGDGQKSTFAYDDHGRLAKSLHADGVEERLRYDALGRVVEREVGSSKYAYEYEPQGKLASRRAGFYEQRFTYDGLGRLVAAQDSNNPSAQGDDATTTFIYESLNNLVAESINGRTVQHAYDEFGNDADITYASGARIHRTYNPLGMLENISFDGNRIADYDYAMFGLMQRERAGNDLERTIAYDPLMRIGSERLASPNDTLYETSYDYDALGRITRADDLRAKRATVYRYDPYSQLISVSTNEGNASRQTAKYQLTTEGDRTSPAIDVGPGHRYVRFDEAYLSYDDRGNLVTNGKQTYRYDPWNRLIEVRKDGHALASYTYDALNRRIGKKTHHAAITYSYDRWDVTEEYAGNDVARQYVQTNSLAYPAALFVDGKPYYYHRNRLGNIVALSDASGKIVERYDYDAYGALTISDADGTHMERSKIGNALTYTGQRYDDETGLYYFKNRYYSPKLGRFLTKDPLGMTDGPNLYAYVNNDPVNWIDPMGTEKSAASSFNAFDPFGAIGWGVNPAGLIGEEMEFFIKPWAGPLNAIAHPAADIFVITDDAMDSYSGTLDTIQTAFDIAGLVPGYGELFDLANGAIYTARGDELNAGLSFSAVVPVTGIIPIGTKLTNKILKFLDLDVVTCAKKVAGDVAPQEKSLMEAYHLKKNRIDIETGKPITYETQGGDIVLGLSENLRELSQRTGAKDFMEWTGKELLEKELVTPKGYIYDAMKSAKKIHLSRKGIDGKIFAEWAKTPPELRDLIQPGITNWEINTILRDPELLKKTVVYDEAGRVMPMKQFLAEVKLDAAHPLN